MPVNKYLIPAFTTPVDPATFGLKPVQFITEAMGLEEHKRLAKIAARKLQDGPILLNCENYPDNNKASKELLETVRTTRDAAARGEGGTLDISMYLPSANVRPFEGAGQTPGASVDRLDEIKRCRREMEVSGTHLGTHITLDAWQPYHRDGHGICFAGLSPMETWRLMMLQRICVAEETRLPVRAVFGIFMLPNGAKVDIEPKIPIDDIIEQTRFLTRRGVEPIFMAGWSGVRYEKTKQGRLPFTSEDRRYIEAFAKA